MKFMRHPVAEIFVKEILMCVAVRHLDGTKSEPYKIVWKMRVRGQTQHYNMTYCDTKKYEHSNGSCFFTDSEPERNAEEQLIDEEEQSSDEEEQSSDEDERSSDDER